jgi:hypothetical protein
MALKIWTLTDGKAGDLVQCLGVARALGAEPEQRMVKPRPPFTWLMPRGPIDPREGPDAADSPIRPPYPDIAIASGRRAVAYLRAVKRLSRGRTFTVFLKDPRIGPGVADFIWVPAHDKLRADKVMTTLTSPHTLTTAALDAARAAPPAAIAALKAPRAAVLVGGDRAKQRFKPEDMTRFAQALNTLAASGVALMGSRSRRTPDALASLIAEVFARHGGFWWNGTGPNPYVALLANADAVIVTADSVNMIGEAAMTGKPVLVFEQSGGEAKIGRFLNGLADHGVVHRFEGALVGEPYEPLDSTQAIAEAVWRAYEAHRDRHRIA